MIFMMIITYLEISSILEGVKTYMKKIITVFEPHRYSRVLSLKEFAKSLLNLA